MIAWDPNPDLFIIPYLNWPIKWYGALFALGFLVSFPIFERIVIRYLTLEGERDLSSVKQAAFHLADRMTIYAVFSAVLGARLGHFLFYENPSEYLWNPLELLQVWKGGLASHGAALGLLIGVFILSRSTQKLYRGLSYLRLLDFISVPAAIVGAFIRVGNFINQEILGTPSQLPWAIVFLHPADGSPSLSRHPVQLYEAISYLLIFVFLSWLTFTSNQILKKGRIFGLFLVLVFGSRFVLEFFKMEQSRLFSDSFLTMGQWLSIPFIFVGLLLLREARSE